MSALQVLSLVGEKKEMRRVKDLKAFFGAGRRLSPNNQSLLLVVSPALHTFGLALETESSPGPLP
jgi:hypothetical protein